MPLSLIVFILLLNPVHAEFTWKSTVNEYRDTPWDARFVLTMHSGAEQQISIGKLTNATFWTRKSCVWDVPWNTLVLDASHGTIALNKPVLPIQLIFKHTTPLPTKVQLIEWASPSRGIIRIWVDNNHIEVWQGLTQRAKLTNWHAREWVFLELTETTFKHQTETVPVILDQQSNTSHEWSSARILPHPGIFLRVPRSTRCTQPELCPFSYQAAPHIQEFTTLHESHWSFPDTEGQRATFTLRPADLYACSLQEGLVSSTNLAADIIIRSTFQGVQLDDAYHVNWDPANLASHRTKLGGPIRDYQRKFRTRI